MFTICWKVIFICLYVYTYISSLCWYIVVIWCKFVVMITVYDALLWYFDIICWCFNSKCMFILLPHMVILYCVFICRHFLMKLKFLVILLKSNMREICLCYRNFVINLHYFRFVIVTFSNYNNMDKNEYRYSQFIQSMQL